SPWTGKLAPILCHARLISITRQYRKQRSVPTRLVDLRVVLDDGPQYHLGKTRNHRGEGTRLAAACGMEVCRGRRLRPALTLTTTSVRVTACCRQISAKRVPKPSRTALRPLAHLGRIVDPAQDTSRSVPKSVPCEEHDRVSE